MPKIEARRYFFHFEQKMKAMAVDIEDRKLTDFGSFFKGNDFDKDDFIERFHVYQILCKLFNDILGEGDILDIIDQFDPEETGLVSIKSFADSLNEYIADFDC